MFSTDAQRTTAIQVARFSFDTSHVIVHGTGRQDDRRIRRLRHFHDCYLAFSRLLTTCNFHRIDPLSLPSRLSVAVPPHNPKPVNSSHVLASLSFAYNLHSYRSSLLKTLTRQLWLLRRPSCRGRGVPNLPSRPRSLRSGGVMVSSSLVSYPSFMRPCSSGSRFFALRPAPNGRLRSPGPIPTD